VRSIVADAGPSVVLIRSQDGAGSATGTGFVIDTNGTIVTNAHVVAGASQVKVRFEDAAKQVDAQVLGTDSSSDLAVLRVDASHTQKLKPLTFADSNSVKVGDLALAIGYPLGLDQTLTQGIVSAVDGTPIRSPNGFSIDKVIQTDAPINPGNSGGPLVSARGEVIGVNTAILSRTGGSHGIGFAVPSSHVASLLEAARERRSELHAGRAPEPRTAEAPPSEGGAYLGILGDDFRTRGVAGVRIRQVIPGSPAEDAGLAGASDSPPPGITQRGIPWTGHIIVAVDGHRVRSMRDLTSVIGHLRPGQRAVLTVTVGPGALSGQAVVTLAERPADPE
jgi:putative serine protease PepD